MNTQHSKPKEAKFKNNIPAKRARTKRSNKSYFAVDPPEKLVVPVVHHLLTFLVSRLGQYYGESRCICLFDTAVKVQPVYLRICDDAEIQVTTGASFCLADASHSTFCLPAKPCSFAIADAQLLGFLSVFVGIYIDPSVCQSNSINEREKRGGGG